MTSWLVALFEQLPHEIEVWIEPFGGGAGAALMAVSAHQVPEAWIVEANPALAAFWSTVAADDGRFAARVEATRPSLSLFDESREIVAASFAGESGVAREDLGYAAFVLNRCSRSGMVLGNVGPIGGRAQAGEYAVGSRFHPERLAERLRAVSALALSGRFKVFEGDGVEYIAALADSGFGSEVFLFVDPPYLSAGERLYASGLAAAAHEALAVALHECPAPWVLTYDAHPEVLRMYPRSEVVEFEAPHSANRSRVGTEFLVFPEGMDCIPETHPLGRGDWWAVA